MEQEMPNGVEIEISYKIHWTVEKFFSIRTNRGQYLTSTTYKIGNHTAAESEWKFYLYPRGKLNSKEDTLEIVPSVKTRESSPSLHFEMFIIGNDDIHYYRKLFTSDKSSYVLRRTPIKRFSTHLLIEENLKIGCVTQVYTMPHYGNVASELLLSKDLRNLRESEEGCDVTLIARGNLGNSTIEMRVHKIILCARSPVFNAMFSGDSLENCMNRVEIIDIDIHALQTFVNYLYSAEYHFFDPRHAMEVYVAADKYGVDKLKDACVGYLCKNITVDNVMSYIIFSDTFNDYELQTASILYWHDHCRRGKNEDEMYSLSPHITTKMLAMNSWGP